MSAASLDNETSVPSPSFLSAAQLAEYFASNTRWVTRHCDGLSHADSLLQPPMRGNCLNWVLGHIAVHRDYILQALGQPKILGEEHIATYDRESPPILKDGPGVVPLETLVDAITRSQPIIADMLSSATDEDLTRQAFDDGPEPVSKMVFFLYWHESYHLGQTEYLRQLAGTDDHIM